jgi:hypothetical protein
MNNRFIALWLPFSLGLLLLLVNGCIDAPSYPIEPVITYEGINKGRVFQFTNGPVDSLIIRFSFTDGDGDLSLIDSDSVDIFLRDSRLPQVAQNFRFPLIDEEGTGSGISGTTTITIVNTNNICCIFQEENCAADEEYPIDTFSYSIQIIDRAGNLSNVINTETVEIACLGI